MTQTATEDQDFIGKFTQPLLELIRSRLDGDGKHAAYWHIHWFQDADTIRRLGINEERYLVLHLKRLEMEGYITYERKQKNINGQNWIDHVVGITGAGRQYLTWQEQRLWRFFRERIWWIVAVGLGVSIVGGLIVELIKYLFSGGSQ